MTKIDKHTAKIIAEDALRKKYPITSYTRIFRIGRLILWRVEQYRFIVTAGVQPKHYPREIGRSKFKFEWVAVPK